MVLKKGKLYFISIISMGSENFEIGKKKLYRLKTEDEDEDKDESKHHFLEIITDGNQFNTNGKYKGTTLDIPKSKIAYGSEGSKGPGVIYPYLIEPADGFYLTNNARKKTMKPRTRKAPTMKGGKRRRTKKNKTTKRRKTHRRR